MKISTHARKAHRSRSFHTQERLVAPARLAPNRRLRAFGRIERAAAENAGREWPTGGERARPVPSRDSPRPVAPPAARPTVARPLIFC